MKLSTIALLGAATLSVAEKHNHMHRHPVKRGSSVQGRSPAVVETVADAVVTVYKLNGQDISYDDVRAGLGSGRYVLVGEKISTEIPAPVPTTPSSTPSAAVFFQKPTTSPAPALAPIPAPAPVKAAAPAAPPVAAAPAPPPVAAAPAPPPVAAAPPPVAAAAAPAAPPKPAAPAANIKANFPSGSIPCSHFPASYGAINIDWMGLGGWSGIQKVPNFNFGVDAAISFIETAIHGAGCTPNSFCSYACPAGYQKSQWPSAQGNTGQSIGGLFCNSNGMLELSRPSVPQICIPGVGNVKVVNKLGKNVAICRTDYPGSESETIPLNTMPGQTYELTCPDSATYYKWQGSDTTAQYYINPAGTSVSDACQWGTAGSNIGNWAPVNCGVGKGKDGVTYISLFPNAPTNPDGVLNFNIKISGDVSGDCAYHGGRYYNNGAESPTGCTVGVTGVAKFEFY